MARAARAAIAALVVLGACAAESPRRSHALRDVEPPSTLERVREETELGYLESARALLTRAEGTAEERSSTTRALAHEFARRGNAACVRGDLAAAHADHETALDLDQEPGLLRWIESAYLFRMISYVDVGALESAWACADRALHYVSLRGSTHRDRAVIEAALGRPDSALADVRSALALDPWDARAHLIHGALLAETDRTGAAAALGSALSLAPKSCTVLLQHAALAERDDADAAGPLVARARAVCPHWKNRHDDVGRLLKRLPAAAWDWLALSPSFDHLLGEWLAYRHATTFRRARELEAFLVDVSRVLAADIEPSNVAPLWKELITRDLEGFTLEALLERTKKATAPFRHRVVAASLVAAANAEFEGHLEVAADHMTRAVLLAPDEIRSVVAERRDAVVEAAATQLATTAESLLAIDPFLAEARAKRAVALRSTPERIALVRSATTLTYDHRPVYVKTFRAERRGERAVLVLQLGAEDGGMVAAPARLAVRSSSGDSYDFEVKPEDYELSEVVVGGQSFGWERTWRSPPLSIAAGTVLRGFVEVPSEKPLKATTILRD